MNRLSVILGNTSCRIALMDELEVAESAILTHAELQETGTLDRVLRELSGESTVPEAVLCSVVPSLNDIVLEALRGVCSGRVERVDAMKTSGLGVRYETPETLGADRLCGVLAAKEQYGFPCVVVDFGTATTVNVVDDEGRFVGGSIAPGIETGFRVLHERTAGLPDIAMQPPIDIVGATTDESIRSGVISFALHAVLGVIGELRGRYDERMPVILTGGNAPLMLRAGLVSDGMYHEPELLFRGTIFYLHLSI